MSPVLSAKARTPPYRKKPSPGPLPEKPLAREWTWAGITLFCLCLIALSLRLLSGQRPVAANEDQVAASPPPQESPAPVPPPAPSVPPAPSEPPGVHLMHSEAVEATMKSLREHSRECPNAADALSEEQIRALEKKGALIL